LLLGVRIDEALGALRSEIDFKQRVWAIPAHRTKANREHKLPLSDFALELLRAANDGAGKSILLFPSPVDSKPIRLQRGL
jgi:integrase